MALYVVRWFVSGALGTGALGSSMFRASWTVSQSVLSKSKFRCLGLLSVIAGEAIPWVNQVIKCVIRYRHAINATGNNVDQIKFSGF
jgi:hypothetical protein